MQLSRTTGWKVALCTVLAVSTALPAAAIPSANSTKIGAPSAMLKVQGDSDPSGFTRHRIIRQQRERESGEIIYRTWGPYWHGHRGYYRHRPGYRLHDNGWWYPAAAFAAGVIIGDIITREPAPRVIYRESLPPEHYTWCARRYRSYRAHDNSFQPYHGPRQACNSPYDGY